MEYVGSVCVRRESVAVSDAIRIILTTILLICPFVCGAEEAVQGSDHAHALTEPDSMPAHCPDSFDNCICQGAVQKHWSASSLLELGLLSIAFVVVAGFAKMTSFIDSSDSPPAGFFAVRSCLPSRAVLQVFRC